MGPELGVDQRGDREGGEQDPGADQRDQRPGLGPAERQRPVDQKPQERQRDRQPDPAHRAVRPRGLGSLEGEQGKRHQPCSRLMFLRSTDRVWRKMARMMASPTAASAAATVMTKKTMT